MRRLESPLEYEVTCQKLLGASAPSQMNRKTRQSANPYVKESDAAIA